MRQFLDRMDKPRVDDIRGIPPAIAIEQSNPVKTSRSTVGTMTEINDYLKLLWPRVARAFCPNCGREIRPETSKSIADDVSRALNGETVLITFWVGVPPKTVPRDFFDFLQQQGYLRIWIDHAVVRVDEAPKIKTLGARVQVIQDRITVSDENRARLTEAIETALGFGKGKLNVVPLADSGRRSGDTQHHECPYSTGWHCAHCDIDIRPPSTGLFSFNNPLGACPECRGFGRTIAIDLHKALPDRSLTIRQGVVRVFRGQEFGESQKDLLRACAREDIDVDISFEELPKSDQDFVIKGEGRTDDGEEDYDDDRWYGVRGFFRWLEGNTYKMHVRVLLSRYRAYTTCPSCKGGRYQPEALNYQIQSGATVPVANKQNRNRRAGATLTLPDYAALSIFDARDMLEQIELPPNDSAAHMLRSEICARLNYLCQVGVGYLTLDRSTRTLSGGEVQRVNLTTCLGASLANTLFVMDEPSIGLHPRDVGQLVRVMHNLRDKGNTLLVVEHEEQIIRAADNLLDIGPGRGEHGGDLVWNGPLNEFLNGAGAPAPSLTRDYLTGHKTIPLPKS